MTGLQLIDCGEVHLPRILHIFNDAIANTTALWDYDPMSDATLQEWYAGKRQQGLPLLGLVDDRDVLAGFATYGPFRSHQAYRFTVEHSIYVAAEARGEGLGRRLLTALVGRARSEGYHLMIGGIEAGNRVSIRLHERLGFELCGTVREAGFKFDRWLDLALYQLRLS